MPKRSTLEGAARRAAGPVAAGGAAAAGIAGAIAARKALKPRRRTILGLPATRPKLQVSMPTNGFALDSLKKNLPADVDSLADGITKTGKRVGRTGKQLAKIATDIQQAGETTERVGKLLSK